MPDARDLMTAHGVRHDTLATSSREESWADLAYPRDDRGDSSFYNSGAGGGLGASQAPAYELSEAERQADERVKAQVLWTASCPWAHRAAAKAGLTNV